MISSFLQAQDSLLLSKNEFLNIVKNCVLDELQERIRIITVTRETMKVLNMDLKYENSEKPMELDDDLEI